MYIPLIHEILCNSNLYSLCLKHLEPHHNNNVLTYETPLGQWIVHHAHLTYIIINLTNMNVICSKYIHLHLNTLFFYKYLPSHKQLHFINTLSSLTHFVISHNTFLLHVINIISYIDTFQAHIFTHICTYTKTCSLRT